MANNITFGNKSIWEPGAYAQILGAVEESPQTASSGNVFLIDIGSGAAYGGGSGINGDNDSGVKSIYEFESLEDFQSFVGGGLYFELARYLFNPSRDNRISGITKLFPSHDREH